MAPEVNINQIRPLIGVLINKKFLNKRNMKLFAQKINQANKKAQCTIYFFSLENVNWERQTINGYVLEENSNEWRASRFPFPNIIYDRGTGFKGEEKTAVETLRNRFKRMPGIGFINSCKLKKWQVYKKLSKHKGVNKFLPVTIFSSGIEDITAMAAKYDYLFLKSSDGSGGREVFALEKHTKGYRFLYYCKGRHIERFVSNLNSLPSEMKRIGLTPSHVVIQQGIRLVQYDNRPLDLRVLMVKDKNGNWNAVYNQARVAPKGAVITNASLGGKVKNYSRIFTTLKKRYAEIPTDKKIRDICIIIAGYIEKEFGSFGEIGIDIGIDVNCSVWLLEANSKPSKLPEQDIEDTVGISPQFLMVLEYARFLYTKKVKNQNQILN